jgi:hypothetical protein
LTFLPNHVDDGFQLFVMIRKDRSATQSGIEKEGNAWRAANPPGRAI